MQRCIRIASVVHPYSWLWSAYQTLTLLILQHQFLSYNKKLSTWRLKKEAILTYTDSFVFADLFCSGHQCLQLFSNTLFTFCSIHCVSLLHLSQGGELTGMCKVNMHALKHSENAKLNVHPHTHTYTSDTQSPGVPGVTLHWLHILISER